MVSGTLKIRQNHWRVVQNQGSLENVKMSSEVAFLVDFGPFLDTLLAPKVILCKKKGSWKSVQKKVPKKLKRDRQHPMDKPDGSRKGPPSRQRVVE